MPLAVSVPGTDTIELSDEQIVSEVRNGKADLYAVLMRRHNRRLYRTIRAVLRDDREVEDVMQQTYLDAYLHLDQFKGTARFSTWLTRIAVNQAIRRRRIRERRQEMVIESHDGEPTIEHAQATGIDPEHIMYSHELNAIIEGTLETIPTPYRLVFVLREVEGLSTQETADCLAINEDTVKTRLHRAKHLLQARLGDRLGPVSSSLYAFHLSRCDRVVEGVMARINRVPHHPSTPSADA